MQVVGVTTQQYVYVASRERPFQINTLLTFEDPLHGYPRGEVIETQAFNRYLPLSTTTAPFIDEEVRQGLEQVGYRLEEETIYLAKVRILEDLSSPVTVGARARPATFTEAKELLAPCEPAHGLTLGVIRGTENLTPELPPAFQNIAPLYSKDRGVFPQAGVPFVFDYRAMPEYPHIGIFGGSGSGKSFGLRVLLEELMEKKVPVVVFDPHYEMSFTHPFPGFPFQVRFPFAEQSLLFNVGKDVGIRFEDLTSNELGNLLAAAGGGFSEAMDNALKIIHQEHRDSLLGFVQKLEHLIDLAEKEEETKEVLQPRLGEGYVQMLLRMLRQAGNVNTLKGLRWRLGRLEREGIFFREVNALVAALSQRRTVVVRGPIWLLTVFGAYLTRKLYGKRRLYCEALQRGEPASEKFPPFFVVTDEAHNFAPKSPDLPAPARGIFREIAQEGRKYGVFLILATQRPALLDDTITAQLNTKIIFRTVRSTDIAVIKEETDLGKEEAERLPYLPSGTAFVSSALVGRTVAVRVRAAKTVTPYGTNPFEELERDFQAEEKLAAVIKKALPLSLDQVHLYLADWEELLDRPITFAEVQHCLEEMYTKDVLEKIPGPFGPTYRAK